MTREEEIVLTVIGLSEGMRRPVYRGQANAAWRLLSSAVRRLQDTYGGDFLSRENDLWCLVEKYHKEELIMPMEVIDGAKLSDLQRLTILQHQGAATGLLDFSQSPLVALWFACEELFKDEDARIFALDIGDPQVALNGRLLSDSPDVENGRSLSDLLGIDGAAQKIVYYEPDHSLGARIIAQQSVFVISNPLIQIPDQYFRTVKVPKESKNLLREYLTRLGLSETTLFADIPGLAAANATSKKLTRSDELTPEEQRKLGNRAYQERRYEEALVAYNSYATALPDIAESHCFMGDTLTALRRFDEADESYTRAIKNLKRPIYLGKHIIINRELVGDTMSRALHYNRGNVRAVLDRHSDAVEDFNIALQKGGEPTRDILLNRGNSKFALELFEEAYKDFYKAWSEKGGSAVALAMGNCKIMMGEFKEAHEKYLMGSADAPTRSVNRCQQNAEQAQLILKQLDGDNFCFRREGTTVFIETVKGKGNPQTFPFVGNQGNTGNIPSSMMVTAPGGEGYEGLQGFAVRIVPATS